MKAQIHELITNLIDKALINADCDFKGKFLFLNDFEIEITRSEYLSLKKSLRELNEIQYDIINWILESLVWDRMKQMHVFNPYLGLISGVIDFKDLARFENGKYMPNETV